MWVDAKKYAYLCSLPEGCPQQVQMIDQLCEGIIALRRKRDEKNESLPEVQA
jgi:hypothetical protein